MTIRIAIPSQEWWHLVSTHLSCRVELALNFSIGAILAAGYKAFARVPATPKDLAVIVAASASHFLLEWPSHREGS